MPELDAITVTGFKSIASTDRLDLRAVNVVIGANGSGKSNFIGVFSFMHALREGRLQDYVAKTGGADRILHFGVKTTPQMTIGLWFADDVNEYRITLAATGNDQLRPVSEEVLYWNKAKHPRPFAQALQPAGAEAGISDLRNRQVATYVRSRFDRWRLYHFHDTSSTSPMKRTADVNDNRFLRPDGSNLAAFLYLLQQRHEVSYSLIRRMVQRVAPFFDDFQLEPQRLNQDKIQLEWKHVGSDGYFAASSLSDGTLRFMALATLFLQPEEFRPSVILVDEPELGLHPYAIAMLASLVQQAAVATQVIVSTQSPRLLDHFSPEDVLVADRAGGGTRFSRLDPAKLASWLEEYSLGQLWEKNEIGGRPGPERAGV